MTQSLTARLVRPQPSQRVGREEPPGSRLGVLRLLPLHPPSFWDTRPTRRLSLPHRRAPKSNCELASDLVTRSLQRATSPVLAVHTLVVPDEADVLTAFEALDVAFERRDVAAIMELFANDADITLWGSALPERAVGREELEALLSRLFEALPNGSFRLEYSERRVHLVGDVAWVNAEGVGTWDPGDGRISQIPYRVTAVLVRTLAGWRWHTHQGSQPTQLASDPSI